MNKVSIIIPIYKVEKYLNKCVESIVIQTYKNLEIILVDDGSPDNCPKMCDEWAKKDERIKVIHKANGGLMNAWIDGVKESTGDYLCFVDSDDYVKEEYVEKLYNRLIETKADVCCCNYFEFDEEKVKEILDIRADMLLEKDKDIDNMIYSFYNDKRVCVCHARWNKIYKKDFIVNAMQYLNPEITMGEDLNLTFYVFSKCSKIAFIKDVLYGYRQVGSSMSKIKKNNWHSYELLLKQLFVIDKMEELNLYEYVCNKYFNSYLLECFRYCFWLKDFVSLNELLSNKFVLSVINSRKDISTKEKIFYWAIKHKCKLLLRLILLAVR